MVQNYKKNTGKTEIDEEIVAHAVNEVLHRNY